ncbi:MAG: exosortase A [Sedimenticola sp.]|nr:exosortase A [Sedimenticola sp.]
MTDNITQTLPEKNAHRSQSWSVTLPILLLMLAAILAIFHETAWSMVSIWYRSETFAHGFIIAPITIWLIWEKRSQLSRLSAVPEYRVLILLAAAGFIWLLGYLVSALVIQQLALVALLIFSIWAVLGNKISWVISFPLAYLFFAVPMGEDLVPPLMEITATATVYLIKLTGVPVFREGLFFSLPSGDWSVVEACSGVRYLIASVTLGALYAYMTYSSLKKRTIFIIASMIVPIIANSLRAYMIVMLGHISDMKIATGVDHLIYGWLFFGLVMLILFAVGAKWRDDPEKDTNEQETSGLILRDNKRPLLLASLVMVVSAAIWPVLGYAMIHRAVIVPDEKLTLPKQIQEWQEHSADSISWKPKFKGAYQTVYSNYLKDSQVIGVAVGIYGQQEEGAELINSQNLLLDPTEKQWRITDHQKVILLHTGSPMEVDQYLVKGQGHSYQVFTWYRIGSFHTASRYKGKLLEAFYRLTFGRQDSARIVLMMPINSEQSHLVMPDQVFLDQLLSVLEIKLDLLASSESE